MSRVTDATPMIQLQALTKRFGAAEVLTGLDLTIARGEWFMFLGPNGAGKTTTIKLIMGLLRPTSGRVLIDGKDARRDAYALRKITGYLPEEFRPYPFLSGREYLSFIADMYGLSRADRRRRADELIELFEFGDAADQLASSYSMGMTRKLGLAAALIPQPDLLVLDEPTGNLDARSANLVRKVLEGLAEAGTTILMSTHILGITEKLCDKIGILHQGVLRVEADQAELTARFGERSLEEIFLSVTGEIEGENIERFLSSWREENGNS